MGQVLSRKRTASANITSDSKRDNVAVSTNGDVVKTEANGSTVQGGDNATTSGDSKTESAEPPKKEKKKKRRFFFNLKRSRPGSGRKKREKKDKNGDANGSKNSGKSGNRTSLFMDEFQIPEDDGIDSVSLSSNEDKDGKKRKNSNGEGIRRSKRGSKTSKNGKKDKKKKQKTEKKKEEKSKRKKSKDSSKASETTSGTLDVNQSVEPLHTSVEAAQESAKAVVEKKDSGLKSESVVEDDLMAAVTSVMDSKTTPEHADESSEAIQEEVVASESAPVQEASVTAETHAETETSPVSSNGKEETPESNLNEDGTPKRVSLGPRLKTAILKKYSGAGDVPPDSRVTLTKPKIVDIPDLVPPPRKKRSMKALSQAASSPSNSELNTSDRSSIEVPAPQKDDAVITISAEKSDAVSTENTKTESSAVSDSTDQHKEIVVEQVLNKIECPGSEAAVSVSESNIETETETHSAAESTHAITGPASEQISTESPPETTDLPEDSTLSQRARIVVDHVIEKTKHSLAQSAATSEEKECEAEAGEEASITTKGDSVLKEYEIHIEASRTYEAEEGEKPDQTETDPEVVIERIHEEPYFGPLDKADIATDKVPESFSGGSESELKAAGSDTTTAVKQKYSKETGEVCKECLCDGAKSDSKTETNGSDNTKSDDFGESNASEGITSDVHTESNISDGIKSDGEIDSIGTDGTENDGHTESNGADGTKTDGHSEQNGTGGTNSDELSESNGADGAKPESVVQMSAELKSPETVVYTEVTETETIVCEVNEDCEAVKIHSVQTEQSSKDKADDDDGNNNKDAGRVSPKSEDLDEGSSTTTDSTVVDDEEHEQTVVAETTLVKKDDSKEETSLEEGTTKGDHGQVPEVAQASDFTVNGTSDSQESANECKDTNQNADENEQSVVVETVQNAHTVLVSVTNDSHSTTCDLSDNNNTKDVIVTEHKKIEDMIQNVSDSQALVVTDNHASCETEGRTAVD